MKAIVYTKYGQLYDLELKEVERPAPKDNELLVKVYAASVNFNNLVFVKGQPFVARMKTGLLKPKFNIPGNDIAGRVEAVGINVKRFQPGDEVFGDTSECGFGAFAEYVVVPENALALKPSNTSFEEAAAVPEAALVALQALRDIGQIQAGQKVLICGASGGIGTFAVQIAKYLGAEVTGVCGTRNLDMVLTIGADHVIDYTQEDFTQNKQGYDLIVATAGYRSIFDYKRALSHKGICVVTGGSMAQIFQAMLLGPLISMTGSKKLGSMLVKPNKDLAFIKELIKTGKIKPVIDRCYTLSEVPEALRYYGKGHAKGKVVITVEHNNKTYSIQKREKMSDKPVAAGKSSFDLIDKEKMFAIIDVKPNSNFLDLACGTGKYSIEIAKKIGEKGIVYAIDLWAEGIEALNSLITGENITNIHTIVADISKNIPIETASADACFIATVLHDLSQEAQDSTMSEVHRILKPEGILIIIEFKKIDKGPGPPISIRLTELDVEKIVTKYEFLKVSCEEIGAFNYLMKFQKTT